VNERLTGRYEALAALFKYPDAEFETALDDAAEIMDSTSDKESFDSFRRRIAAMKAEEREELYTRTFDLNPVCTLEIGWQLFGEDYKRGAFLVKMRQLLREHGIPEETELPDHLTYMLSALDRIETESGRELAEKYIRPALKKMIDGFKERSNPYFSLLQFLDAELAREFDSERRTES